jgi:phage-related protein
VLKEILASFGFDIDEAALSGADSLITAITGNLKTLGAALAGAFAVDMLQDFAREIAGVGAAIDDTSRALGLGVEEYQELTYAAKQSGVETQELNKAILTLQRNLGDPKARQEIERMGVALEENGKARNTADVFTDVGLAIAKIEDPAKRNAEAMKYFGKSGAKLFALFQDGKIGIEQLRKELHEIGGVMDKDTVAQAAAADDSFDRFEASMMGVKYAIAAHILPAFTALNIWLSRVAGWFSNLTKHTSLVQTALVALGAVGAAGLWKVVIAQRQLLLGMAKQLLIWGLIFLVVEDLFTFLRGGDSVFGRLLDKWFGAGAADIIRNWCNETIDQFKVFWDMTGGGFGALWEIVKQDFAGLGDAIAEGIAWLDQQCQAFWISIDNAIIGVLNAIAAFGTGVANTVLGVWNSLLTTIQSGVGTVAALLSKIPGTGDLAGKIANGLEALKVGPLTAPKIDKIGAPPSTVNAQQTNNFQINGAQSPQATAAAVVNATGTLQANTARAAQAALKPVAGT